MSEITAEEYQATAKKGNKYGAKRCEEDGYTFDSLAERKRYRELKQMEQAGEIEYLKLQPRYPLKVQGTVVATYVGDFLYRDLTTYPHRWVVEDVKGVKTPVYRLKKKLVKALYGIEIQEVQ